MISVVMLVVVVVCLLYRYVKDHYQMLTRDGLPGPTPTPFIGNLREFAHSKQDPLGPFMRLTQKYGKVFGYYQGWAPCVVVSDPGLVEQILVKHFHHFDGRPTSWPFQHGSERYALQNLNGPQWRMHREVIASAFRTGNIRKMWPRLRAAAQRYVDRMGRIRREHPEGFNVVEENELYSLEAFTSAAFDVAPEDLSEEDRKRLLQYMRSSHKSASPENPAAGLARVYPSLSPLLKLWDTEHRRQAQDHFHYMAHKVHLERRKMSDSRSPRSGTNILQHFLSAVKKHSNPSLRSPFPLSEVQGMMSGLVGGGLGPASTALDFCVHCLALHPHHQNVLLQELWHHASFTQGRPLTMELVQELQHLDMFVSECLRCYPVAPGVTRTCRQDCVVEGVVFRRGTVVRLMGSVQYMDPHVYPDPHRFRPDRFSKQEREKRHPYNFIPFGAGPRMCVARSLSLMQVKVALLALLQRFEVQACPLTLDPLPLTFKPFLCPRDGVWVRLVPRTDNEG